MSERFDEEYLRALFTEMPTPDGISPRRSEVAAPVRQRRLVPVGAMIIVLAVTGSAFGAASLLTSTAPAPPPPTPTSSRPATSPTTSSPPSPPPSTPTIPGVPAGTKLTEHIGDLHVRTAGTVLSGLSVTGTIYVEAPRVTIRLTRVVPRQGAIFAVRQLPGAGDLSIEDSELAGDGVHRVEYALRQEERGLTVRRVNVHTVDTGLVVGSDATIVDSYIHDLNPNDSAYGIVAFNGGTNIAIRGNKVLNPPLRGSAIAFYPKVTAVVVEDNLLSGGFYTLRAGAGDGSRDISITGNRFGRPSASNGSGPVTAWAPGSGNRWERNIWDDTGQPLSAP